MTQDPSLPPPAGASFPSPAAERVDAESQSPPPRRPRVWPIPLVLVASFCSYLIASFAALLLAAAVVAGRLDASLFGDRARLALVTESAIGLAIILVLPQMAMAMPAVLAALASPVALVKRLGLVRGHWPLWLWGMAALGTPLIGMISSAVVGALLGESKSLDEMSGVFRAIGQDGYLIPLALLVGVTPGICEELVFRGYVQTRLTRAWGALLGILSTSVVFAVFHMDLVHSVAVVALGIYLGWIAWASGSILPAMLAHFFNNFLSVLAVVLLPESIGDGVPLPGEEVDATVAGVLGGGILISAACLLVTLVQGVWRRPPAAGESTLIRSADSPTI